MQCNAARKVFALIVRVDFVLLMTGWMQCSAVQCCPEGVCVNVRADAVQCDVWPEGRCFV